VRTSRPFSLEVAPAFPISCLVMKKQVVYVTLLLWLILTWVHCLVGKDCTRSYFVSLHNLPKFQKLSFSHLRSSIKELQEMAIT